MDKDVLLEKLTTQDIIDIMKSLGSGEPSKPDNNGNIYFKTICHNGRDSGKYKLQYFIESKLFHCYTECGTLSIFDIIKSVNNCSFVESIQYICKFKGIKYNHVTKEKGLKYTDVNKEEMEFLQLHLFKSNKIKPELPEYNSNVLKMFDDYIPVQWLEEDITEEQCKIFGIQFYFNQGKAIIPHYDINGRLIGIRGRAFLQQDLDKGQKYMPVTIEGLNYRFPSGFNLYGIYQNQENIKRIKKAIIWEGEKSVLKYGSYFGKDNNISLATMGMNFTNFQKDILLKLGVEEVIIAYDKQYELEYLNDVDSKQYKDYCKYIKNIIKISKTLVDYMRVSIILCWDNKIDFKDAPIDKGKETFLELYNNRYLIEDIGDLEELIE